MRNSATAARIRRPTLAWPWTLAWGALLWGAGVAAAPPVTVVRSDFEARIPHAAQDRSRFAIDLPHHASSETDGRWTIEGSRAVWRYAFQIPTATTVSFHTSRMRLPASAVLHLTASGVTYTIRRRDVAADQHWSRVGRGDTMALELSIDRRDRAQTLIEIVSVQGGYRGLTPGIPDHPAYRRWAPTQRVMAASCVENYECHVTADNQGPANATVALLIANQYGCTGTLLNDVAQDGKPYVLTARHCQNGQPGGGDPSAAATVTVYWDAVTACGGTLGSVFDASAPFQSSGTTVVEQQDAWLIRLSQPPVAGDAYYAGWDASGAPLTGGYSVHHANLLTKQYVGWAGTAVRRAISGATLGVPYTSNVLELVNGVGSIDHGASGSGLFTPGNAVIGSASRANPGQCPASPPPPPSDATATAQYQDLAAIWTSTSDPSSTTGAMTIAQALDPAATGALTQAGISGVPPQVTMYASFSAAQVGTQVQLDGVASYAQSCTASGGVSGDGWAGPASSTGRDLGVTESAPGAVTYTLTCNSGSRAATASVSVVWSLAPPTLVLFDQGGSLEYAGAPNTLMWNSNQSSCTPSGGTPGDGWTGALPGSGSLAVTESHTGAVTYTLTCGSGAQAISSSIVVNYSAPTAALGLPGPPIASLRIGQPITLMWSGSGGCVASGGQSGDGWAGPLTGTYGFVTVTANTAADVTYVIACGPAAAPATAQVAQLFTNDPPTATLTAPSGTPTIDLTESLAPPQLTWTSNIENCGITYAGPTNGTVVSNWAADASIGVYAQVAGTYTYTLTCGTGADQSTATASLTWLQPTPHVTLTVPPELILGGQYLYWLTNVLPCVGSGGTAGDGWNGTLAAAGPINGTVVTETQPGAYTYTITCGVGPYGTASASTVFNNPAGTTLSLGESTNQAFAGQRVALTWTSTLGPCTGYGGTAGDGWDGAQPMSGTAQVTEPGGNFTLALVCGSGAQAVQAQVTIAFFTPNDVSASFWPSSTYYAAVGDAATLTWDSYQAASCTATGGNPGDGWNGTLPTSGTVLVRESAPGSVTYGLTCSNGALSGQASFVIGWNVKPTISLQAGSAITPEGIPVSLTWSATNAAGCTASADPYVGSSWNGPVAAAGSAQAASPGVPGPVTYSLTCLGVPVGSTTASVTVTVDPPPTVALTASASTVQAGTPFTLSWSSSGATSCTASGGHAGDGWSGSEPLNSAGVSIDETAAGIYNYGLQCSGDGGPFLADVAVDVTPAPAPPPSKGGGAIGGEGLGALLGLWALRRARAARERRWRPLERT